MIAELKKTAEGKMTKTLEALKADLQKVRTGRAHTGLLDHVQALAKRHDTLLLDGRGLLETCGQAGGQAGRSGAASMVTRARARTLARSGGSVC